MNKGIFFGACCLAACQAFAADPVSSLDQAPAQLNMQQAEAIALNQAPGIGVAYFTAEASKQQVIETRSAFFPQITADVTAAGTAPGIANAFGAHYPSDADYPMRLGATGGLSASRLWTRESNGINATQLLYDFGRTADLTAASRFEALSDIQKAWLAKAQTVLEVDVAYLGTLKAIAILDVANQTLTARKLVVDDVSALASAKLKSDLDANFAQVQYEQAQQLLLQAQNVVDDSFVTLCTAMGYRKQSRFSLAQEPFLPLPREDVDTLTSQALENRPEAVALKHQVTALWHDVSAAHEDRLPRVTAFGSMGVTPVGESGVTGDYGAAGLNVELPVFTGGLLSAKVNEAAMKARAAEKNLQEEEDEIVKEVHISYLDSCDAFKNISVTAALASNATQTEQLAEARYKVGTSSIVELSQAQLEETQAQLGYTAARYDFQIALERLQYAAAAEKYRAISSSASRPWHSGLVTDSGRSPHH